MVVTGREGQVVRSLAERAQGTSMEVISLGRPELDLASPPDAIVAAVEEARPDVLVSAAAYTQVDRAEAEPELAFAINERGARSLARAARELAVPIIHLSTDYVFDGQKSEPYVEGDLTQPAGVYGSSKLAGEQAVLEEQDNSVVLRTAWVYSPFGANFIKTMLRLAAERDEVRVVADQRGNPTNALDLADGILAMAARLRDSSDPAQRGVFHIVGRQEATWAGLAQAIFAASAKLGGPTAAVTPITTEQYPTTAQRPANSQLDCSKLARVYGIELPEWPRSLKGVVMRLVDERSRSFD
jgi:dTDP-4-dehydrorhamnose reductase